ncbi:2-isopropylmalate synthase [Trema orientale]|uniref:2-isopropylmalate synthase n=1 Tax=Trema orientale TaxID=63057 RepID=A0A2P5EHQ2_TREOI|nr:2-isopropylmalate synthase [Trema orientale]
MVSKRRKKLSDPTAEVSSSHAQSLQTLISSVQASEGLKPPFLKNLYSLLVHLSSNESIRSSNTEDSLNCLDCGFNRFGFKLRAKDRRSVAEILFLELDSRFRVFFSVLCDVSAIRADQGTILGSDMWASVDELTLLLRCCLVILTLVDPEVLFEKTQFLLLLLKKLISLVISGGNERNSSTFHKSVSRECSYRDASCATSVSEDFVASLSILEPSHPCHPPLLAVLEVFADELLLHRLLKEYFMRVDSASGTSRVFFRSHFANGYSGSVVEVISVHFILSFSDELAFENFSTRLTCRSGIDIRVPELSLTAAVSLLNPIVLSTPKIFQAHLILLVSEAIGIETSSENVKPNLKHMNNYLTAFEKSVTLYAGYLSTLLKDSHPVGSKGSYANSLLFGRSFQPSFECHMQEATRTKIYDIGVKSDSLWNSQLCNMFYNEKPVLLAESIAYINESQQVFDESCKDDVLSILSSIILGAFSDGLGDTVLYKKGETSPQDIYLLAAVLKLMSSSMTMVIWCLRHDAVLGCLKTLEDASSCKEYDFIVDIIGCFQHFNVSLPNQKKLFDTLKTHMIRHKTTKWILLHFQGLLSLSFASGIDFLVKNCVSMIVTLMNLYVFEEGSLDVLRTLLIPGAKSISSKASPHGNEALGNQKLSKKIASKIQKIKTVYLSCTESPSYFPSRSEDEIAETSQTASLLKCRTESTGCGEEETEESRNGKVFLKCVVTNPRGSETRYCDDLADFVECKRGKDYSSWLKDRERYRRWKSQKMAVLRWQKRRSTWKGRR